MFIFVSIKNKEVKHDIYHTLTFAPVGWQL